MIRRPPRSTRTDTLFPYTTLFRSTRDQHSIAQSVSVVIDFLEGKIPHAELPLDVRATAFQRRVWNELIAIPCGETRTYSEIAEIMGVPRGQRAVGRACATTIGRASGGERVCPSV